MKRTTTMERMIWTHAMFVPRMATVKPVDPSAVMRCIIIRADGMRTTSLRTRNCLRIVIEKTLRVRGWVVKEIVIPV